MSDVPNFRQAPEGKEAPGSLGVLGGLTNRLIDFWYAPKASPSQAFSIGQIRALTVLEALYRKLWRLREGFHKVVRKPFRSPRVKVIAVGNLVVGGAGKTPCVLSLAQYLADQGIAAGILSRGYKSQAEKGLPKVLMPYNLMNITPEQVGDEAWLMAWRTQRPVAVGKDRRQALDALLRADPALQVVILDDGLQQRSVAWDISLLVIDERGFGNGYCLPLGPLREPLAQLDRFSGWIDNGFGQAAESGSGPDLQTKPVDTPLAATPMPILPELTAKLTQRQGAWIPLAHWRDGKEWLDPQAGISRFRNKKILAVAGIAVPERFFALLQSMGLTFESLPLDDHDPHLVRKTLEACARKTYDLVLMTEKDAVKFFHQDTPLHEKAWALRRESQLDHSFLQRLIDGPQTA